MPAVLTHMTVMLMARKRLLQIRDDLAFKLSKREQTNAKVTDLELRIEYLADRAVAFMSVLSSPAGIPRDASPVRRLLGRVSPFAVMGSMGPDITAFTALLAPNQAWLFDTVHKGNPDENREPVFAKTTDFAIKLWEKAREQIAAGPEDDDTKKQHRSLMRAYVLGHVCHLAADILSHPFINDIEWHLGHGRQGKLSHYGGEGSIDARVAQQILGLASPREGEEWAKYWPTLEDVPDAFYAAYGRALDETYSIATDARPRGFGQYEERFSARKPPGADGPKLDPDLIRDGYRFFRGSVIGKGYGWGIGRWFAFLIPAMLPFAILLPLTAAAPYARRLFSKNPFKVQNPELAIWELLTFPLAATCWVPMFYGIWISSLTTTGVEAVHGFGLLFSIVLLGLGAAFFTVVADPEHDREDRYPKWFRWAILFVIPAAICAAFVLWGIIEKATLEHSFRFALGFIYGMPIFHMLVLAIFFATVYLPFSTIDFAESTSPDPDKADAVAVTTTVLVSGMLAAGVLYGWFVLARTLRDFRVPENPKPFAADRPHFARVFDDSTLFHESGVASPTRKDLFFPSGRRPLLKLWWDGDGDLYIRSGRIQLEFGSDGSTANVATVPAPIAPMTATELGDLLVHTVKDKNDPTKGLRYAPIYAGEPKVDLPPGATFADHGDYEKDGMKERDEVDSVEKHDALVGKWKKLGKTQGSTDYVLFHSPKSVHAVRFGRGGPVASDSREDDVVAGTGTIESSRETVTGDGTAFRAFFVAGDLIRAASQVRTVTLVTSDKELKIDSSFEPSLPKKTKFERVGPKRELAEGYTYVSKARSYVTPGDTIMDYASDFAALLCLGATTHLLDSTDMNVPSLAAFAPKNPGVDSTLKKVQQVFRDWSLDRRRENEWRMLVHGDALAEEPIDPAAPAIVRWGAITSNSAGWVGLLRQWFAMARDKDADPTLLENQALSRGMAFLFDMPDPVVVQ